MAWRAQINDHGVITRYKNSESGEVITAKEYDRRMQMQQGGYVAVPSGQIPQMTQAVPYQSQTIIQTTNGLYPSRISDTGVAVPAQATPYPGVQAPLAPGASGPSSPMAAAPQAESPSGQSPLIQPGAQILSQAPAAQAQGQNSTQAVKADVQTASQTALAPRTHAFLDSTSIAILLPSLVLLAIITAAAHKKRLFPWQTVRTFNPPSGLMTPREYQFSFLCPPNLRKHGRMGKANPNATWTEQDGIVLPFGFLARTQLPVTIPLGRLPNKNMFIVAPSGSGKTTLMRAIIKAMMAKPCVIIALEAKANDPNLDQKREGFKYTVLPEAKLAGFDTLYFNPLDEEASIHWNPLDTDATLFASSIVQDVNSLEPEQQHWAERDFGYIEALTKLLKWGAVEVASRDEAGAAAEFSDLPCNPRGLMELVYNRDNIIESLRKAKINPNVDSRDYSKVNGTLTQLIQSLTDFNNNIQGVRGRLRMFRNKYIQKVTEESNVDLRASMHKPTVLIFGAPASLGPDAESLAACFVYQLEQALHTRYGTVSVLPLFAFFDEYQTLNIDMAGRLSAIVRGANGGLTIILQNISQIAGKVSSDPTSAGSAELKTIFSNSAVRICLHNADESTARFFSDEIGKHAVIVPGLADQFSGGSIFPNGWKRIHSQQVVPRIDPDSIKRMEKQHALIYLAPAGDGEHGELKPFMVDLRGIEEIARLHLMHNVSNRAQSTEGQESAIKESLPSFAAPNQSLLVPPARGHEEGAQANPEQSGAPIADKEAQAGAQETRSLEMGELDKNVLPQKQSVQVDLAVRTCPHCWQPAGKGRFCIECGREIGLSAPSTTQSAEPTPYEIASEEQGFAQPSLTKAERQPLTSLDPLRHPDHLRPGRERTGMGQDNKVT